MTSNGKTLVERLKYGAAQTAELASEALMDEAASALEAADTALTKIDAIRNSIIGCQSVNFSEHVYPLVAALGEAGYEGLEYAESRKNVGTMLERTLAAEGRAEKAEALLEAAEKALEPFAAMYPRYEQRSMHILGWTKPDGDTVYIGPEDFKRARQALGDPNDK